MLEIPAGLFVTGFFISLGFWARAKITNRIDEWLITRDQKLMQKYADEFKKLTGEQP